MSTVQAWIIARWRKDTWTSTEGTIQWGYFRYDKVEHLILGFLIGLWSILLAIGLNVGKESWDEFVPSSKFGKFGGDGFSFHDLIAGLIGTALALVAKTIWG
jgi:hypothetical protein